EQVLPRDHRGRVDIDALEAQLQAEDPTVRYAQPLYRYGPEGRVRDADGNAVVDGVLVYRLDRVVDAATALALDPDVYAVPLPWRAGTALVNFGADLEWFQQAAENGMPVAAGISGTATRFMVRLDWLQPSGVSTGDFLGAVTAFMLPHHHSLYEIVQGMRMAGLPMLDPAIFDSFDGDVNALYRAAVQWLRELNLPAVEVAADQQGEPVRAAAEPNLPQNEHDSARRAGTNAATAGFGDWDGTSHDPRAALAPRTGTAADGGTGFVTPDAVVEQEGTAQSSETVAEPVNDCLDRSLGRVVADQGDVVGLPDPATRSRLGRFWGEAKALFRGARPEGFDTAGPYAADGNLIENVIERVGPEAMVLVIDERTTVDGNGIGAHAYTLKYLGDNIFEIDGVRYTYLGRPDPDGHVRFRDIDGNEIPLAAIVHGTPIETASTRAVVFLNSVVVPNVGDPSTALPADSLQIGTGSSDQAPAQPDPSDDPFPDEPRTSKTVHVPP
ncbi:hypothetical protein ACFWFG_37855, partial [Streptomyces roseolus]